MTDLDAMALALDQAKLAACLGEVPIGAILVRGEQILAQTHNTREQTKNPLHHAEIQALEIAAKAQGDWRLNDCTLYVTLEPCPMCLGALFQARMARLVFGCFDEKREREFLPGKNIIPNLRGLESLTSNNHTLTITGGVIADECAQNLRDFFAERRQNVLYAKLRKSWDRF